MSPKHRKHRDIILHQMFASVAGKYNQGQKEHGGNLWEKPLANEILAEATDFYIYAATIQQQHKRIAQLASEINTSNRADTLRVAEILRLTQT